MFDARYLQGMESGAEGRIDRDLPEPPSGQLAAILRARLTRGDWHPGKRMASERVLAVEYDTSRPTVRKALDVLVAEGRLFVIPASGTFVAPRVPEGPDTVPEA
jgi:GntR family transcriptional regulator